KGSLRAGGESERRVGDARRSVVPERRNARNTRSSTASSSVRPIHPQRTVVVITLLGEIAPLADCYRGSGSATMDEMLPAAPHGGAFPSVSVLPSGPRAFVPPHD